MPTVREVEDQVNARRRLGLPALREVPRGDGDVDPSRGGSTGHPLYVREEELTKFENGEPHFRQFTKQDLIDIGRV